MTPEEVLFKAAEIISTAGHVKGAFDDGDCVSGAVCMEGAYRRAMYGTSTGTDEGFIAPERAWRILTKTVEAETDYFAPCVFNDADETTAEDAILMLKRAAERARDGG
ncbi:hypothetical protein ACFWPU_00710 [Streptomyces sp. NPDC058471]|uniref:DUF6197 family protein n=1 Tax=Streptomyces sp. NPDC058471 TaxID=3346516 RepID=UPI0036641631